MEMLGVRVIGRGEGKGRDSGDEQKGSLKGVGETMIWGHLCQDETEPEVGMVKK